MKTSLEKRSEMISKQPLLSSRWVLVEFRTFLVLGPPTASRTVQEREREIGLCCNICDDK